MLFRSNRICALLRRKARNLELMENQIIESIRTTNQNKTHYILLSRDR